MGISFPLKPSPVNFLKDYIMNFKIFKQAVANQFDSMSKNDLFRVDVTGDELWDVYLKSFPAGTDPIFRKRTEHDCNCCKQFIRAVGNVVAIVDGKIQTIWDGVVKNEPAYQAVTEALEAKVRTGKIVDAFFYFQCTAGTDNNFSKAEDGSVTQHNHFFVNIPARFVALNSLIPTKLNDVRTLKGVFERSLNEIDNETLDTVLDLISQNSFYRCQEHKFVVESFLKLKKEWKQSGLDVNTFVWSKIGTTPGGVAGIRNTVIGTLLTDIAGGGSIEDSVKAFEHKVAPANYKRPTALVTKKMIEEAKKKVQELGLESALQRRYANIDDITINNILFADRGTRLAQETDVFGELAKETVQAPKNFDKVEEVSIDKFLSDVLPRAKGLELYVESKHTNNLVSLIAPDDPSANNMFKWDNRFSWSYNGDLADSIKERVKKAGGNVTGDLCCRLAWDYSDDLDFHMREADGFDVNFRNRRQKSRCGGELDVDANGADGIRENPVENIFYDQVRTMKPGTYTLYVHNWARRSTGKGFDVEIDLMGDVYTISHEKVLGNNSQIDVAQIIVDAKHNVTVEPLLNSTSATKSVKVWGVNTNTFNKVNVAMLSPNYWDDQKGIGNKHFFFMLDGCINDGVARGFYNEFLNTELDKHRKVLEMVGTKLKTEKSDQQLSGVGFSSTQKTTFVVRVTGATQRVLKVVV